MSDETAAKFRHLKKLKGGENQDQRADYWRGLDELGEPAGVSPMDGEDLGMKVRDEGVTNVMDFASTQRTMAHFNDRYNTGGRSSHIFCVSKHGGIVVLAKGNTQLQAVKRALAVDPKSPFGGVFMFNQPLEHDTAQFIDPAFFEGIIAPGYEHGVVRLLTDTKEVSNHKNRFLRQVPVRTLNEVDGPLKERMLWRDKVTQTPFNPNYDLLTQACIAAGNNGNLDVGSLPAALVRAAQFGVDALGFISSNTVIYTTEHAVIGVGNGVGNRYFVARNGRASMEESLYHKRGDALHAARALAGTPFTIDDFADVLNEDFVLAGASDAFYPDLDGIMETLGVDRVDSRFIDGKVVMEYTTTAGETKVVNTLLPRDNFAITRGTYDPALLPQVVVQPGGSDADAKVRGLADLVSVPMIFLVSQQVYKGFLEKRAAGDTKASFTGKRSFSHPTYE